MDKIKEQLEHFFQQDKDLISLALIDNPFPYHPMIDGLDLLVLVVKKSVREDEYVSHFLLYGKRIQIRKVEPGQLEQWLIAKEHRHVIQWLERAEVFYDPTQFLEKFRQRAIAFPEALRQQKLLIAFSDFLHAYMQAKQDLHDGHVLDAHSSVLLALHHWAHIALIEDGTHPELTVWRQMRRFHPGIYKLYEELTASMESLEQRVKLVLIASEFTVLTKMKTCCALLLHTMGSRKEPWRVIELKEHPDLRDLPIDTSLLLQKLVMRGYVRELEAGAIAKNASKLELFYAVMLDIRSVPVIH